MSDSPSRSRLLELLRAVIGKLERFLASSDQFPFGIAELDAAAEYLAGVGLKPDGDWLLREYDSVLKQGFALVESERWASDPEGAKRLGYSPQFSGESEKLRDTRRKAIRGMVQQMLGRLRMLLHAMSGDEQDEARSASRAKKPAGPGRQPVGDKEKDRRFYDDWKASGQALKDFVRDRGVNFAEAAAITARERTRRNRERRKNRTEHRRTE
jgi:hypothetical protein